MVSNFLSNVFGGLFPLSNPETLRIANYIRHVRLYNGFSSRVNQSQTGQWKKVEYNLAIPIIEAATDFLASSGIKVSVVDDPEATAFCEEYWEQSGGDDAFINRVRSALIKGDAVVMPAVREEDQQVYMKWLNPVFCNPVFDVHDMDKVVKLTISYEIKQSDGKKIKYTEVWEDGTISYFEGKELTGTDTYDQALYGNCVPVVWIKNDMVDDEVYGRSDLLNVARLIEKYDHLRQKEDRMTDYYMAPNVAFTGVSKSKVEMTKGERTVYFLPEKATAKMLLWDGTAVGVRDTISDVRNAICVVSQTPEVVLQKYDGIQKDLISGVALKILYQPLLSKTRKKQAVWTVGLAKAFRLCLLTDGMKDIALEDVKITYEDPLPKDEAAEWTTVELKQAAGMSKRFSLREAGYTDEQINEMEQQRKDEAESANQTMLQSFNRGVMSDTPYPPTDPAKPDTNVPTVESKPKGDESKVKAKTG